MNTPPIVRPGEAMCRLDELADPAAKAFTLKFPDGEEVEIFVVRRGESAFAYLNECPHQAYPLCDRDAGFLNLDGSRIVRIFFGGVGDDLLVGGAGWAWAWLQLRRIDAMKGAA